MAWATDKAKRAAGGDDSPPRGNGTLCVGWLQPPIMQAAAVAEVSAGYHCRRRT
jgi:hypothetical protein